MHRQSDGKVRRSPEEWERILERYRSSGMTGAAFCRREKIAKASFEKWKKKAARRSKPVTAVPTFVELPSPTDPTAAPNPSAPLLSSGELELSFPGGVVIRWKA